MKFLTSAYRQDELFSQWSDFLPVSTPLRNGMHFSGCITNDGSAKLDLKLKYCETSKITWVYTLNHWE